MAMGAGRWRLLKDSAGKGKGEGEGKERGLDSAPASIGVSRLGQTSETQSQGVSSRAVGKE